MPAIELRFDIEETTTSIGRVTVDQGTLAAYMAENDITTLTVHDLRGFLDDEGTEIDYLQENVTGQTWADLRAGEGTPNEVTVPLHQELAAAGT